VLQVLARAHHTIVPLVK